MCNKVINTVTGQITPDQLGATLMHEHFIVGSVGWQADILRPSLNRDAKKCLCLDKINQIQSWGIKSIVDCCPNVIGRDVKFMAELSTKTGLQIICGTGLYDERGVGSAYWPLIMGGGAEDLAELFIKDITEGIGNSGIKAGIIKVATREGEMTPFENAVLQAAAMAAKQTGIPVVVHAANDEMGDRQQALLIEYGVPANRIVLEHGFNTPDQEHHLRILNEGSYIGIDRIGGGGMASAENFATLMMALINKGRVSQIIVSNNSSSNRCRDWLSSAKVPAYAGSCFNSGSFHDTMIPMLKFMGADDRQIEIMLIDNPRRFFSNGPLPQSV